MTAPRPRPSDRATRELALAHATTIIASAARTNQVTTDQTIKFAIQFEDYLNGGWADK
ncbi:hypothetical protein GCM10007304_18050 [Rhodococcoides trifolii]|uniref:Uncharacterized protein n=1 Tax=Rhodococcoides trifolii TaxID=908250 RepID=A0A917CYD4_9NOCA|nr:hypothetical protein [Rhodococcus trifolii]GGG04334.1 hypothetical protein GCM10007304_18050 [Rhodococcus trifolii]